ncbi:MAG: cupin domain-containing protein [Moorea sp. SIO3I7]|uniref:cupin domain-containing protein n=1 Tax=unclassified Moorena TaxID=2683338 RepID=UPI0013C1B11E|nr:MULTISPECIES: cupin domain-containing protein [unclassified Moorena]NEO00005.1 cupin domain-containing protein [Moorena sp. SIO3I7]NEO07763.1 cupin domain-containing protein [Moorena sp. SIO3I8]NEO14583.1 cupin domain-containing protein [Moorena sp. SIO3E8]NEP99833.1 cupin domain-containing protein [Moorena sp. SIO3F7]NEQ60791.1 cupin domain-containing protein [Moorena sp. SIO4A1]
MSKPTNINKILIERPSEEHLDNLGVSNWPIWTKEVSEFPWTYDDPETCYLLEGEVVVTPDGGEPVQIAKGDLVTFPAGMSCTWKILSNVRKHYQFG